MHQIPLQLYIWAPVLPHTPTSYAIPVCLYAVHTHIPMYSHVTAYLCTGISTCPHTCTFIHPGYPHITPTHPSICTPTSLCTDSYTSMHLHTHTPPCTDICTGMLLHTYTLVHTHIPTHPCTCTPHACASMPSYTSAHLHVCLLAHPHHTHLYIYTPHPCIHTHPYICIPTHLHAYIPPSTHFFHKHMLNFPASISKTYWKYSLQIAKNFSKYFFIITLVIG